MPLKVRSPDADMLKRPSTRPRMVSGAFICTSVCAMLLNESSKKPAQEEERERERIDAREREAGERAAPERSRAAIADAGCVRRKPPPALEQDAGEQRARGVGAEQQRVRGAGIAVAEVVREAGHLRLVAVADEERRRARRAGSSRRAPGRRARRGWSARCRRGRARRASAPARRRGSAGRRARDQPERSAAGRTPRSGRCRASGPSVRMIKLPTPGPTSTPR